MEFFYLASKTKQKNTSLNYRVGKYFFENLSNDWHTSFNSMNEKNKNKNFQRFMSFLMRLERMSVISEPMIITKIISLPPLCHSVLRMFSGVKWCKVHCHKTLHKEENYNEKYDSITQRDTAAKESTKGILGQAS
jgi:hypothetical protein